MDCMQGSFPVQSRLRKPFPVVSVTVAVFYSLSICTFKKFVLFFNLNFLVIFIHSRDLQGMMDV